MVSSTVGNVPPVDARARDETAGCCDPLAAEPVAVVPATTPEPAVVEVTMVTDTPPQDPLEDAETFKTPDPFAGTVIWATKPPAPLAVPLADPAPEAEPNVTVGAEPPLPPAETATAEPGAAVPDDQVTVKVSPGATVALLVVTDKPFAYPASSLPQ